MSTHMICDCCHNIIYDDKNYCSFVMLNINIRNRYRENDVQTFSYHLCKVCDMKIAKALLSLLPNVAGQLEPNVFITDIEKE